MATLSLIWVLCKVLHCSWRFKQFKDVRTNSVDQAEMAHYDISIHRSKGQGKEYTRKVFRQVSNVYRRGKPCLMDNAFPESAGRRLKEADGLAINVYPDRTALP